MNVLFYDFETNSLNTENCAALELGAILWDFKHGRMLGSFSYIIYSDMPPLFKEITDINGITDGMVKASPVNVDKALERFIELSDQSDYHCAHNGLNFDKPILDRLLREKSKPAIDVKLIDTRIDIDYPKACTSVSLQNLAKFHGIAAPFPHSALCDCETMLQLLMEYDIGHAAKRAEISTLKVWAEVTYDTRELAKERRYTFDRNRKEWYKLIRSCDYEKECLEASFKVRI